MSEKERAEMVNRPKGQNLPLDIEEEMSRYAEKCASNPPGEFLIYLKEVRGLSDEIINRYQIGFCSKHPNYLKDEYKRITVPIRKEGKVVNIRFHAIGKVTEGDPKSLPYRSGLPEAIYLFPEDQLKNNVIYLVKGELDALSAISHGLPAITVTGGAGSSWKDQWTPLFNRKKVRVIYDCDTKGRKGAGKLASALSSVANEVKVIDLGLGNKEDLINWFVEYGRTKEELEELVSKAEVMEVSRKVTPKQKKIRRAAEELSIQSLTLGKLLSAKFAPEQSWVNRGLVAQGTFVLLAGLTKQGKTTLTLQLCLRLVQGHCTFLRDFEINTAPKILYIFAENSAEGLQNIIKKQLSGLTWIPSEEDLQRLILQPRGRIFLDNPDGLCVLEELLHIHKPDLVVIDPISRFIGRDINEMRNVNYLFDGLSQIGNDITWFFIHHYRKPKERDINEPIYKTMGSSAFANNCDTFIGLERTDKHRAGLYCTLSFVVRRAKPIEPVHIYWNPENLLFEVTEKRDIISGGIKPSDVIKILKEEFNGLVELTQSVL